MRRAKTAGANLPLDWENLAEEIESLGKSQRRELASQIGASAAFAKMGRLPGLGSRAGWHGSIKEARAEIEYVLTESRACVARSATDRKTGATRR